MMDFGGGVVVKTSDAELVLGVPGKSVNTKIQRARRK